MEKMPSEKKNEDDDEEDKEDEYWYQFRRLFMRYYLFQIHSLVLKEQDGYTQKGKKEEMDIDKLLTKLNETHLKDEKERKNFKFDESKFTVLGEWKKEL